MSQKAIERFRQIDMSRMENQLVFQCAPLIAGLKMSYLLIIHKKNLRHLCDLLQKSEIRCRVLYPEGDKLTVLLYRPTMLAIYLRGKRARKLLLREGYESFELEQVLLFFTRRYREYRTGTKQFPHELGLLLGYPLEDVEGFIGNDGKNCLYTGYWKVYSNVPAKRHLFRRYERARDDLMEQLYQGAEVEQVISQIQFPQFQFPHFNEKVCSHGRSR